MDSVPALPQFLASFWRLRCQRLIGSWPKSVKLAAQFAIDEPISRPVTLFGYDSRIWIDPSGKEIVSDPRPDQPDRELTPSQQAEALRIWECQQRWLESVAEGTHCPVELQSGEVELGFLVKDESYAILMKLEEADAQVLPEGAQPVATQSSDSWEWAVGQVLQRVQTSGITQKDVEEYAQRVSAEELKQSSAISAEIARLDDDDEFRKQFWAELKERFPDDLGDLTALLSAASVEHSGTSVIRKVAQPDGFANDIDGQDVAATAGGQQPQPRLQVDVGAGVIYIDGLGYAFNGSDNVKTRVAEFYKSLIDADGEYVKTPDELKTRTIENQHVEVRDLIKAQPGAGRRISRERIWRS